MPLHLMTRSAALVLLCSSAVSIVAAQQGADDALVFVGKAARVEQGRKVDVAVVIGDDLEVAGEVGGVAAAVGGDLHVVSGARVDGPAVAIGGELRIDDGATVVGPRVSVAGGDFSQFAGQLTDGRFEHEASGLWIGPLIRLAQMLALFVIAVLLVSLVPRNVQGVRQTLVARPGLSAAVGLLFIFGMIPLCVLLALSLVGIPLIPVAILGLLAAGALGLCALAATLGYALPLIKDKDPRHLLGATSLGLAVLTLGALVPFFGGMVLFVASAFAAGAVLLSRFGARPPAPPAQQSDRPPASSEGAASASA